MLIAFGGLPGSGKSTVAAQLAADLGATYLRIDIIEQALRDGGMAEVGPAGYMVAYGLAESNLRLGRVVVVDSVNPLPITRAAYVAAAARAGRAVLQVECVCTDAAQHRRRVETRASDIPGLVLPDWAAVVARQYAPWPEADLTLDTARLSPAEAVAQILASMPPGARSTVTGTAPAECR